MATPQTRRLVDRSRIEAYRRCPRERFWGYEYGPAPGGLSPVGISMYQLTGIATHAGVCSGLLADEHVDTAVDLALAAFDAPLEGNRKLYVPDRNPDNHAWVQGEQRALVEGLVRMAAITVIRPLLQTYEVVCYEKEMVRPLVNDIDLQGRSDAVLRDRETGDLFTLSVKTTSGVNQWTEWQFAHDTQGITEPWLAEAVLGEPIAGTLMLYLIKGTRIAEDRDDQMSKRKTNSPLLKAWRTVEVDGSARWAWKNEFIRTRRASAGEDFIESLGMIRRPVESYVGRLGKEWEQVSTWDNYPGGMKGWVDALAAGEIQPELGGDPFAKCWYMPPPNMDRTQEDRESELVSIRAQETHITESLHLVKEHGDVAALDVLFPHNRQACVRYNSLCGFHHLCFGPREVREDPLGSGLYVPRGPHHPGELVEGDE